MKLVWAILLLLLAMKVEATNFYTNNASDSDTLIQSNLFKANPGDFVYMLAGTHTISTQLTISNGLNFIGAGSNSTILTTALTYGLTATNYTPNECRVSGFTLNGQGNSGGMVMQMIGTEIYTNMRLDSCIFTNCGTFCLRMTDVYGVVDHNTFVEPHGGIYVENPAYGGQQNGDGSWTNGDFFGTWNFCFIETNVFIGGGQIGALDGCAGSRIVFRYNLVTNDILVLHGTDSTGRPRGGRSSEVYMNTFYAGGQWGGVYESRSGVTYCSSNSNPGASINFSFDHMLNLKNYRSSSCGVPGSYPPWGACNGSATYDGNQNGNGYPAIDQCGRGAGTLLTGSTPSPTAWPNEALDPTYQWGNTTWNGSAMNGTSVCGGLFAASTDYYDNAAPAGYKYAPYPHVLIQAPAPPYSFTWTPTGRTSRTSNAH